jgi:hypothetical protein
MENARGVGDGCGDGECFIAIRDTVTGKINVRLAPKGRVAAPVRQIVWCVGPDFRIGVPDKRGEAPYGPFLSHVDQRFDCGVAIWS